MKAMEAPGGEPPLDRVLSDAELDELSSRHDAILPARQGRDLHVRAT